MRAPLTVWTDEMDAVIRRMSRAGAARPEIALALGGGINADNVRHRMRGLGIVSEAVRISAAEVRPGGREGGAALAAGHPVSWHAISREPWPYA